MPVHQYTPQEALDLLMKKLRAQDESLASQVQLAIDAGKDITETEPATVGRKKERIYRKSVPFSHEEALQVALDALQAYFVEQPMCVNSVADNFAKAVVGFPTEHSPAWPISQEEPDSVSCGEVGEEKIVEIELQTETQISKTGEETLVLKRTPKEQIDAQRQNIVHLRRLTDFKGE